MTITPPQATQDAVCESCRERATRALTKQSTKDESAGMYDSASQMRRAAVIVHALPTRADEGDNRKQLWNDLLAIAKGYEIDYDKPASFEVLADKLNRLGYSRRTEAVEYLAKYDAGMMAAAEETIAFLKQTAPPDELANWCLEYAAALRRNDGWFATMPLEISNKWLEDAAQFEKIADALVRRTEATPDTDAVKWIRVVSEELIDAGFPPGDRDVALSSIRALIKGRTEATGEAREVVGRWLSAFRRRRSHSRRVKFCKLKSPPTHWR